MRINEEKRATLQALSEYIELLLELSNDCTARRKLPGSRWDWTAKNRPPEKLTDELIEQLKDLSSQVSRSQILMLSGSSLTAMHVYYMNMYIQLLLQRDVFARQFKALHQLQDSCSLIINCLQELCAKAKDGGLPEAMKEVADIEQLESTVKKTGRRLKRIQNVLNWFDGKLKIYADIEVHLDRLSDTLNRPWGLFGLVDMPYNFREEVKLAEPLVRALSLHRKYARDRIDPDQAYPDYAKGWDLALADECQEFQNHIKSIDQLITDCGDIPDIAALAKLVTKML